MTSRESFPIDYCIPVQQSRPSREFRVQAEAHDPLIVLGGSCASGTSATVLSLAQQIRPSGEFRGYMTRL